MRLYLARHGNAIEKSVNPERPLSVEGRKQIEKLAALLKPCKYNVYVIFHSEKLRATQTAEILSSAFHSEKGAMPINGLAPLDPVLPICNRIYRENKDTVFVGHLPFLDHLVAFLINGDEMKEILSFPEGGMVCLERFSDKKWKLRWFLNPDLIQ